MSTWDDICHKHDYSGDTPDVAIFGSAIRTHLWMRVYDSLIQHNNCTFKIFFCGHVKPDFELPENFVHIHSEMEAAPCVEIAYRNAMKTKSKYIMNFTDDCLLPPSILDTLIQRIESNEEELVVGPAFRINKKAKNNLDLHMITNDHNSPLVPLFPIMRRSTSEKVGGLDKRFGGIFWDLDRALRLHAMETIKFEVCEDIVIVEDKDPKSVRGINLFNKWMGIDHPLLHSLWTWTHEYGSPMPPGSWVWWPPRRSDDVQFYSEEDLQYVIG